MGYLDLLREDASQTDLTLRNTSLLLRTLAKKTRGALPTR